MSATLVYRARDYALPKGQRRRKVTRPKPAKRGSVPWLKPTDFYQTPPGVVPPIAARLGLRERGGRYFQLDACATRETSLGYYHYGADPFTPSRHRITDRVVQFQDGLRSRWHAEPVAISTAPRRRSVPDSTSSTSTDSPSGPPSSGSTPPTIAVP